MRRNVVRLSPVKFFMSTARKVFTKEGQKNQSVVLIRKMLSYVWPAGQTNIKVRVVIAFSLLVGAKVCSEFQFQNNMSCMTVLQVLNIAVPFLFKEAVDYYNRNTGEKISFREPLVMLSLIGFMLILGCKGVF